jgi:gag-polypeptide of LTR copia-type
MSGGIPSLTILSEEQKFNGENLLQWNTNITQLLGSKGLLGYVNGNIPRPGPESIPLPTSETPAIPAISTPIYSSAPTFDEWNFRDQLARGHITLNCTDVASLGVVTTGTAKEAWDSIQTECGKSMDMRRSHAQEILNRTKYVEGTEIQDHIKLLRTRRVAVDNLSASVMTDETWQGIIIRSIPPIAKWLPVIPSLYMLSSSADIISTLLAHGMVLGRYVTNRGGNPSNTVLVA